MAAGTTGVTAVLPASPANGDLHVMFVGSKPYTGTISTPAGWTLITNADGTNGTTANGTDVGSVKVSAFYKYWVSGDGNPTASIASGNTAAMLDDLARWYGLIEPMVEQDASRSDGTLSQTVVTVGGITTVTTL